jgi:hypothetical protein
VKVVEKKKKKEKKKGGDWRILVGKRMGQLSTSSGRKLTNIIYTKPPNLLPCTISVGPALPWALIFQTTNTKISEMVRQPMELIYSFASDRTQKVTHYC